MSNKQSSKKDFSNCFLDLQRAAIAFYLNPRGKTHQVFLKHAQKILRKIKGVKARKLSTKILQIEREIAFLPKDNIKVRNLADKMLTFGLLSKGY